MTRPSPPHGIKAHLAISAELVRLTIGRRGPTRPELEAPIIDDRTQLRTHTARKRRRKRRR